MPASLRVCLSMPPSLSVDQHLAVLCACSRAEPPALHQKKKSGCVQQSRGQLPLLVSVCVSLPSGKATYQSAKWQSDADVSVCLVGVCSRAEESPPAACISLYQSA
jgi:hypothetical protein